MDLFELHHVCFQCVRGEHHVPCFLRKARQQEKAEEEEEKEANVEASLHIPLHPQVTHWPHPLLLALIHYG